MCIAAELLKLVERAVLDPEKEGKPSLREGKFDWYIFKNGYINSGLLTKKKEKEKKGHRHFGQSKVHLSRYNLRKCTIKDSAK